MALAAPIAAVAGSGVIGVGASGRGTADGGEEHESGPAFLSMSGS